MFKCVRAIGYVPYWCHYLTFIGRGDGRRYSRKAKPTEPLTQSEAAFQIFEQEVGNIWTLRKPRDSFQLCLWCQSWHIKPENNCFPQKLDFWSHPVKTSHADLPAPPRRVEPRRTVSRVRPKCMATFALSSFRSRVKLPLVRTQHFQEASYC